jgi:hypothetical protein
MKRFPQWLFDGLAVISLGLCIGVLAIGIGFRAGFDRVIWRGQFSIYSIFVDHGEIGCSITHKSVSGNIVSFSRNRIPICAAFLLFVIAPFLWMRHWVSIHASQQSRATSRLMINAILSIVCVAALSWQRVQGGRDPNYFDDPETLRSFYVFVIVAVIVLWLAFGDVIRSCKVSIEKMLDNRQQAKTGFCKNCGYDLRATPNRCPECGTIPKKAI